MNRQNDISICAERIDPARLADGRPPKATAKLMRTEAHRRYFTLSIAASNDLPAIDARVQVNRGDAIEALRNAAEVLVGPEQMGVSQ